MLFRQIFDDFAGDDEAGNGGDEGNRSGQRSSALGQLFIGKSAGVGGDGVFCGEEHLHVLIAPLGALFAHDASQGADGSFADVRHLEAGGV